MQELVLSGTPSGCRRDLLHNPEVFASLRPPATLWQSFGLHLKASDGVSNKSPGEKD